ncbi:MAG: complex I subunit 5 family protein, partial [bacterium]
HPSAPAPISAMLSGVLIKTLGIYALVRVTFSVFGVHPVALSILQWLGAISVVIGVLPAVGQVDIKRMLAYCSISQIGYITIGISLGTPLGILGALFHLMNHAFYKSLLFLNSGSLEYELRTRNMRKMGGITKEMPVTGTITAIGALAISGIPPLNGFWSKFLIILATIQSRNYILTGFAGFETVVTIIMFAKLFREVILGEKRVKQTLKEVPLPMTISVSILAFLCVAVGLAFPYVINILIDPAKSAIIDRALFIRNILGG